MTGPFLHVQESKLYGRTWINVARITKIQGTPNGTTIFLDGASTIQIDEAADALLGRLEEALTGPIAISRSTGRVSNGARRARSKPAEEHGGS